MRIITAFTLQNSGRSDKGTVATLAAAFWVASIEMGKPLSPEQLGCGCPSMTLLHDWEIRYAAECFAFKCHRMREQGVEYIHFAGDHGHRQQQDTLVKGLDSVDDYGQSRHNGC